MLGSAEQMEAHATRAPQARIKMPLGPLLATTVPQVQFLWLAASQKPPVSVTLDIRGTMENRARSAVTINTNQAWGLMPALIVHQTLYLHLAAIQKMIVNVKPVGRETILTALHAWLVNTNWIPDQLHALPVQPASNRMLSMHPRTLVLIVQLARTRRTTGQSVCCV